jgi:hypothetical protein
MSAQPDPRPGTPAFARAMPWWCAPAGIALGFLLPLMFIIAFVGEAPHPALTIRGVRFLDTGYLLLGGLLILVIALGGWIGAQLHGTQALPDARSAAGAAQRRAWDRAALVVGGIALMAFTVWFRDFLFNPALMWQILTGAYQPDRKDITLTPGLTSLANVAPVFFSIYAFRLFDHHPQRLPRSLHALGITLALLTVFRVYAWSERLAMIEMAVPFGLMFGRWASQRSGPAWAVVRLAGPYAAIPLLVLFFGLAEYARAWSAGSYQNQLGFWEFALGRFASYYFTSLNNGAGLLATTPWPTFEFEYTLEWLHRAPFGLGRPFSEWVGFRGARFDLYLSTYEDVEFNSPSGVFAVIADLGLQGGIAYTFGVALAAGLAFRAHREERLIGLLAYPMFFISFMEIYRYPYLGQPRAFTWALGLLLALLLARWQPGPAPNRHPATPPAHRHPPTGTEPCA